MPENPLEQIERLSAAAHRDAAPEVDVAEQVLRRIRQNESPTVSNRMLGWLTAAAVVVSVIVIVASVTLYQTLTDPMAPLYQVTSLMSL
jgi:hypothetical protein